MVCGYVLAPSDASGGWEIMKHAIVNGRKSSRRTGFEFLHPERHFVYGWRIRCRTRTTHFAGDHGTLSGSRGMMDPPWMDG